jgi:hypothetical protein
MREAQALLHVRLSRHYLQHNCVLYKLYECILSKGLPPGGAALFVFCMRVRLLRSLLTHSHIFNLYERILLKWLPLGDAALIVFCMRVRLL